MNHPKASKQIIVVLGMHRSGTSAVTRGLKAIGVDLGDKLIPGAPNDNDKGFWEDEDIYRLNEEILRALGCRWDSLRPIEIDELTGESMSSLMLRAANLLDKKISGNEIFGFKDPRVCRLLPFWQKVFQKLKLREKYVIVSRNPISVARSLEKRNALDPEKSYLLWLLHTIPAISLTKGKRRIVVDYDNLIADPVKQLKRIADALDMAIGNELSEKIAEYAEEFLVKEMRHTLFNLDQILNDRKIPGLIAEVYALLLNFSGLNGSRDDFFDSEGWGEAEKKFDSLAPICGFLDRELNKLQETYKLVDQEIRRYSASEQALLEVVAKKNQELAEQGKHIEELGEEVSRKSSELKRQDKAVRGLLETVEKKDHELSEQGRHIEMFRQEIARKSSELEQQDKTVRGLLETVEKKDHELSEQGRHIEVFRQEIARKVSELERQDATVKSLLETVAKKDRELSEQGRHIEMFREEIARKSSELEQQDKTVRALLERVAKKELELSEQGRHIEMFREEIVRKSSELEQQDRTVRALLERVAKKDRELSEQGQHIEMFREEIARKSSELEQQDKTVRALLEAVAKKELELSEQGRHIEMFREEIARKASELETQEKMIGSLIAEKDYRVADLNKQISELLRITGSPRALFREFVKKAWFKVKGRV